VDIQAKQHQTALLYLKKIAESQGR